MLPRSQALQIRTWRPQRAQRNRRWLSRTSTSHAEGLDGTAFQGQTGPGNQALLSTMPTIPTEIRAGLGLGLHFFRRPRVLPLAGSPRRWRARPQQVHGIPTPRSGDSGASAYGSSSAVPRLPTNSYLNKARFTRVSIAIDTLSRPDTYLMRRISSSVSPTSPNGVRSRYGTQNHAPRRPSRAYRASLFASRLPPWTYGSAPSGE